MAFDMNNQEIMALIQQLGGQQNPLGQPPLSQMDTPPSQAQPGDNPLMSFQDEQALSPINAAQNALQQQPQQSLGTNMPQDFGGTGLGDLAPGKPKQGSGGGIMDLIQLLQLSQQGIGGF